MTRVHTDNLQQRYQQFHDDNIHYQTNNWLVDDLPILVRTGASSIIEIGTGNGRFLDQAASAFARVAGIDFARSPILDDILTNHPNIEFHQLDITAPGVLDRFDADLVVSADVFEHLLHETLDDTLAAIDRIAPLAWHTVACYEADWTHPSVFPPEHWLERFQAIDPQYRIARRTNRRDRTTQPIVTIAKGFDQPAD